MISRLGNHSGVMVEGFAGQADGDNTPKGEVVVDPYTKRDQRFHLEI